LGLGKNRALNQDFDFFMTTAWPPLSSVIIIPLIASLIALCPWFAQTRDTGGRLCRVWALLSSAATLVVLLAIGSAALSFKGLGVRGAILRVEEVHRWIPSLGITWHLTLDGLSFVFSLLTCIVSLVVIAWSSKPVAAGPYWYALLLLAQSAVLGAFLATDLVLFYLFYELMLLPVLLATVLWGSSNRVQAAFKFLLFTVFGSVFMFLSILYLGWHGLSTMAHHVMAGGDGAVFAFEVQTLSSMPRLALNEQLILALGFLIAFAVKIPVAPLHGWMADTYREAPYGIAAFTAALLGKVGLYGVIRFVIPLFPDAFVIYAPYMAALGAISVVFGGLIALTQRDVRSLLAYSSLSHLGFCVLGVAALNQIAVSGAVFQALSHGLVTVGLFLVFGFIIERNGGASDFGSLGGLADRLPVAAFILMLFSLAAVALPLTSSFVGEFLILLGAWRSYPEWVFVAVIGVVIGAIYTLTAYMRTMFGECRTPDVDSGSRRGDIRISDLVVLGGVVCLVIYLGVAPAKTLSVIEGALSVQTQIVK
jgi:NADH-quinone oxidoreductase subunit M